MDSCVWPLFEVVDGKWILNYQPKNKLPVEEHLKPQGLLFKPGHEHLIAEIQANVDDRWEELLTLCNSN